MAVTGRYTSNVSWGSASIVLNALIQMWYVRVLTQRVGVEGYALVSMAAALTLGVNILTSSLNGALGRFLTVSLSSGDEQESNGIFNSAFFGILGLVLVLMPIVGIVAWQSPQIFNTIGDESHIRVFTFLVLASTLVSSVSAVFNTSFFVRSRFDLSSMLQVCLMIVRAVIVLGLFALFGARIDFVGAGMLFTAFVGNIVGIFAWRHFTPNLHLNHGMVNRSHLRELLGMGGWVSVDTIGMMMISQLNTILVGNVLNTTLAGMFGLYIVVRSYISIFGGTINGPVQPEIYNAYGQSDNYALEHILYSSIRISLAMTALLSVVIVGFRNQLIYLWLGDGYHTLALLLAVGVPIVAFSSSLAPFLYVLNARKKTSQLALATVLTGVAHMGTCLALYFLGRFDVIGVVFSSSVWTLTKMFLLIRVEKGGSLRAVQVVLKKMFYFGLMFLPAVGLTIILERAGIFASLPTLLLSGLLVIVVWGGGVLIVLEPADLERVLGRLWSRSKFGLLHKELYARKMMKLL